MEFQVQVESCSQSEAAETQNEAPDESEAPEDPDDLDEDETNKIIFSGVKVKNNGAPFRNVSHSSVKALLEENSEKIGLASVFTRRTSQNFEERLE